ncbi:MAG: LUD domain-containing protein [Ignavibacteriae bacterium]|nr:LUD domain-containing protein [Ignavibacteriota bacterium]
MSARDDILHRLSFGSAPAPDPAALDALFATIEPAAEQDPVALLLERAREHGCEAARVPDAAAAALWITDFLTRHNCATVAAAPSTPEPVMAALQTRVSGADGRVLHVLPETGADPEARHARRVLLETCDAGLTGALAGFAMEGGIALRSSANESRAVSLLTRAHVAIVRTASVYPSLAAWSASLSNVVQGGDGSAVTLVTGPSKTADIEKVLVTGVHGPKIFAILVLDEGLEPDAQR